MAHSSCKCVTIFHTYVWDSKRIHVPVCFLPVCLEWRGMVDILKSRMPALCPLYIIHHTDRPFHSWIQNSSLETTSNTLGCPRLVRTSLPARWTPLLNFCRLAAESSLSNGEIMTNNFYFLPFFSLLKIWKFSSRGWFSKAALVAWPLLMAKRKDQI